MYQAYRLRDKALNEELLGNYGLALELLSEALKLLNSYYGDTSAVQALVHFDIASVADKAGMLELARESYARCAKVNSVMAIDARLHLAKLLLRSGQIDNAYTEITELVDSSSADARAYLLLSLVLREKGQLKESEEALAESKRLLKVKAKVRQEGTGKSARIDERPPVDEPLDDEGQVTDEPWMNVP